MKSIKSQSGLKKIDDIRVNNKVQVAGFAMESRHRDGLRIAIELKGRIPSSYSTISSILHRLANQLQLNMVAIDNAPRQVGIIANLV